MSAYGNTLAQDARLKILRLLMKANEAPLNHELLQLALMSMSIRITADQVKQELSYLQDLRCVTLLDVGTLAVATLTDRGSDVAKGLSQISGVALYVPGSGQ